MYVAPAPTHDDLKPENRFEFKVTEDGLIYSVPKLAYVKPALVAAMTGKDAGKSVFMLFTEYAPKALEELSDNQQLGGIYEAWALASGVGAGESSGSTVSSSSTAEPSIGISSSPAGTSAPVPTTSGILEPTA